MVYLPTILFAMGEGAVIPLIPVIAANMGADIASAALVGAALVACGARRRILGAAVLVTVAVVLVALALGSGGNVLSFVTQQTGRGLQIESPVSTPWL